MNGRIYDPTLGRFLQADPHIQAPTNSQNYNRYSYVLNNPMSYTDPSGYFFKKLFKGIKKYWRQIASIGMMFIPGMQAFAMKSWINAAMVGFASRGIATGSLRGALVGAFSGAALQQIGASATWGKAGSSENIIANAAVGGVAADLNGGKFGHGFFAAGFTASLKPQINQIGDGAANYAPARITAAAVVGGTASAISGGKFANGAVTGAFIQMFNAETRLAKENKMEAEYGVAVNKAIKKLGKLVGNIGVDEDGGFHGAAGGKLLEGVTVVVDDSQKVTVLGGPVGFSETFQGVLTDSIIALSPGVLTFGYAPASHMSTWSATVQFPGAIGPYVKLSGQFNLQQAMSWHPSVRRTIRTDNYICNSAYKQVCGG